MPKPHLDQWFDLIPRSGSGSGRQRLPPAAKLTSDGQLVLNHSASEMLGNPERVRGRYNPGQRAVRLYPATPGDQGSFSLSGGGNAQCRISCRELTKDYPHMVGDYKVSKASTGVLLTWTEE
jgi:hypothetical protein